jgi:hypothetical protein
MSEHPDFWNCNVCGQRDIYRKTEHECPGDPNERISELEERISVLEEQVRSLQTVAPRGINK